MKKILRTFYWRGEEDIGVDRILCDGWVEFDESVEVSL